MSLSLMRMGAAVLAPVTRRVRQRSKDADAARGRHGKEMMASARLTATWSCHGNGPWASFSRRPRGLGEHGGPRPISSLPLAPTSHTPPCPSPVR